jgi:hypothetical protein
MDKYEFVSGDEIVVSGKTLKRIRSLINIKLINLKVGDLGGYIEREKI